MLDDTKYKELLSSVQQLQKDNSRLKKMVKSQNSDIIRLEGRVSQLERKIK